MSGLVINQHQFNVSKNTTTSKSSQTEETNKTPLKTPINQSEKYDFLNKYHYMDFVKSESFKNEVLVRELCLVYEDNKIKILDVRHKSAVKGHKSTINSLKKKVSTMAASVYFPTPFLLFKNELTDNFSSGIGLKLLMTSFFTVGLSLGDLTLKQLSNGFIFLLIIAICDAILGVLPNTVKTKKEQKDHTLQAKLWMFLTNLLGITGSIAIHVFLSQLIKDPNLLQGIAVNCHYLVIAFVGSIYFYRIIRYIATANKTRVPKAASTFFKKEG